MPLVWIVAPALVFVLFTGLLGKALDNNRSWSRWLLFGLASIAAALSAFATLLPMRSPGIWKDHQQFAWIGIRGKENKTLSIGGDASTTSNIGWPLNRRYPFVVLSPEDESRIQIQASSQSGFVRRDSDHKILNGSVIADSGSADLTLTEDGITHHFKLTVAHCGGFWIFERHSRCLSIEEDGIPLTDKGEAKISFRGWSDEKVESLAGFLEQTIRRLRHDGKSNEDRDKYADQAGALERWSSTVELLARQSGKGIELHYLALDPGAPVQSIESALTQDEITSNGKATILWPQNNLTFTVISNADRQVELLFDPPYHHSTPPPPLPVEKLTLERRLSPGDFAFLLPFPARNGFDGKTVPLENRPIEPASHIKFQLPDPGVPYPDFDLLFKFMDSVPMAGRLTWPWNGTSMPDLLLLAWLGLLVGFACLFINKIPVERQVIFAGFTLAVWTVLCIRFLLAFRFSYDPSHLDHFSVRQMYSAVDALILIPTPLALCCVFTSRHVGMVWRALLLIIGIAWVAAAHWLMADLWLWLPAPIARGDLSSLLSVALFALAVVFAVWEIKKPGKGSSERVTLRDLFIGLFEWNGAPLLPKPFRGILLFAGSIVILFCVHFFLRIPSLPSFVRGLTKEVFVAAFQCGAVWYAIRAMEKSGERRFADQSFSWWVLLRWCFVLFLFAPIFLDDVGGILAGWSFLIPLLIMALLSLLLFRKSIHKSRTRSIAFTVLAFIALLSTIGWAACRPPLNGFIREHLDTPATLRLYHWLDANGKDVQAQEIAEKYYSKKGRSDEQELSETDEQTWQNKAMIVLGGMNGAGFGNAPVRRSAIPQNTLEADSTFSFFIASEYGRYGAIALIVLFSLPLILTLMGKGPWTSEKRMAVVLASAFLVELMTHILMNMEVLPMTGRSMPMLAPQSSANTLRWALLLGFSALMLARSRRMAESETNIKRSVWLSYSDGWAAAAVALVVLTLGLTMWWWNYKTEMDAYASNGVPTAAEKENFKHLTVEERQRAALIYTRTSFMTEAREYTSELPDGRHFLSVKRDTDGNPIDGRLRNDLVLFPPDRFRETKLAEEVQRFNGLPLSRRLPVTSESACADAAPQERQECLAKSKGECIAESRGSKATYMRCLYNKEIAYQKVRLPGRAPLFELTHEIYADKDREFLNTEGPDVDVNPEFQNVVDFELNDALQLPSVVFRNAEPGGAWRIEMAGSRFILHSGEGAREPAAFQANHGKLIPQLRKTEFYGPVDIVMSNCSHVSPSRKVRGGVGQEIVISLDVDEDGNLWGEPHMPFPEGAQKHPGFNRIEIADGRSYETSTNACDLQSKPAFAAYRIDRPNVVVGKAWEGGEWKLAWNHATHVPWVPTLAGALQKTAVRAMLPAPDESNEYRITLDPVLQESAAKFVDATAAKKYFKESPNELLPFRAGLVVLDMANGEVLASVGWPHTSDDDLPQLDAEADGAIVQPAERWLQFDAPASLRLRFLGDHNFEALPVGSSSKPIWASAALSTSLSLAFLHTRKTDQDDGQEPGKEMEQELFGVPVTPGWRLENASKGPGECCGLDEFLAFSDNRFQTRLNFAALAVLNGSDKMKRLDVPPPAANPAHESFDGGTTWGGIPDLSRLGFRPLGPNGSNWQTKLDEGSEGSRLVDSSLAKNMQDHFPLAIQSGSSDVHSLSYWTGRYGDDVRVNTSTVPANAEPQSARDENDARDFARIMGVISPQRANLALDKVVDARGFVTILLGGSTNRWSNVNLASGFYTALTCRLMLPHILAMQASPDPSPRQELPREVCRKLEKGLYDVVAKGTAAAKMASAKAQYKQAGDYEIYGKTGTLSVTNLHRNWSRIVIAVTPHSLGKDDEPRNQPWSGLIFSFYVEDADQGTASAWANDFLTGDARQRILTLLERSRKRVQNPKPVLAKSGK